ncbi:MAG TPA: SIMPL domain-containing protein [Thermoanaerobaculia bacterium]|nr:SIMPL domain-containing protein [Thermoanaerobaculia bacterium]
MPKRAATALRAAVAFVTLIPLSLTAPLPAPLEAQMPEPPPFSPYEPIPSITVNGEGEVRTAPDEAMVRLGVVAQREQAREAQGEASRIGRAILDAIAALGVPEEAVQTSQLVLTPVYEQPRYDQRPQVPTEPRIIAYRAANAVTVRLADLAKIGPVIDAGIAAGANQLEGVSFQLNDDRPAREEALRRAVAAAQGKAAAIAAALGVELGPVLEAREGGISIQRPQLAARAMVMEMSADAGTPVAPGEVTVTGHLTIRYRIGG